MFWGLIMEPQRRYTQKVKKAFHISMAALDVSTTSDEPAQVMVGFEGRNYLLCTLRKPDLLQCSLDLNFEVGDELSLAANGKCHVHLTGYLIEDPNEFMEEEDEEVEVEEEEAQEKEVKKKNKKKNKQELENGPPVKKAKPSTTSKNEDSEDDDDDGSDIDVKALLENTLQSDTDEEDETFASDDEDHAEEEEVAEEEDDSDVEDLEDLEEESSLSENESDEELTTKNKGNKVKMNGSPKKQDQQSNQVIKKKEKKDKKNEQKKQQNKNEPKMPSKENQSPKAKESSPKKTLQGGLIIEDLKEGQGQPCKPGKFISVYYEGRLKSNNKVFDSTKQGQGFSFRLGGGEVIKGWDSGLVGMKVGGKRRITCPPNMAYGAKGSPPAIPANSTLVFDVELRKIR